MAAAPDYDPGWAAYPAEDLSGLLASASSAVGQLADAADLAQMADGDAGTVMDELTTLVARLDGLRVAVAREVRDRRLYGQRAARSLAGWLRADARLADDAWKIGRLAAMTPDLPRITSLLTAGTVGLSQAGTACWQISQLPDLPRQPDQADYPGQADTSDAGDDDSGTEDRSPDDAWAGLWRSGDVHAAADELFSRFIPGMDSEQLRQMGAHLREAADTQERACQDYDEFARRGLRISRSFGGTGQITGRLHPEAAEQVIAAFEELGAKTGPDDPRTKAQRWADVLARLAATSPAAHSATTGEDAGPTAATREGASPADRDDDEPCADDAHTGHDHSSPDHNPHGHSAHGSGTPGDSTPGGHVSAAYRRPRMIVTVPLSTLLGQPLATGAILGAGTSLSAEAARRLACDAEIIRLVTGPGTSADGSRSGDPTGQLTDLLAAAIAQLPPPLAGPSAALDIGRKSPGWTARQRDALFAQYGGHCSFGRCGGPIDVIHHIIHWLHGGRTRTINGAPFCLFHHWLVHEGGWRVEKHPDGRILTFPPPPGWRPGTIYRRGKPVREG